MSIIGLLTFTNLNGVMAQDNAAQAAQPATEQVDEQTADSMPPLKRANLSTRF